METSKLYKQFRASPAFSGLCNEAMPVTRRIIHGDQKVLRIILKN